MSPTASEWHTSMDAEDTMATSVDSSEDEDEPPRLSECSPQDLLGTGSRSRRRSGPLIVDLDETLWLRNSTEAYLDSIRPRWLVGAVLVWIRILRPWRLFGSHDVAEDWFRVLVCSVLFPWALPMWAWRLRWLGPTHLNRELVEWVERESADRALVVATRGFAPVVRPLVASFDLPVHELVACRLVGGRADRSAGKAQMLVDRLGADQVGAATVISDSEVDRPLLDRCADPVLCRWPEARYEPAPMTYVPFAYTELYKRAEQRYVYHIVLGRDLVLWVLATVTVAEAAVALHVAGLFALLVSFWCVYEIGYLENDRVAERYEDDPVLPARPLPRHPVALTAWIWSIATGAIGVALVAGDDPLETGLAWALLLVGLRLVYLGYNHVDKGTRQVLYALLQALRLLAPIVVVPVAAAGLLALLIVSWSRSMLYVVYRVVGTTWVFVPHGLLDTLHLLIAYGLLWYVGVELEVAVVAAMAGAFLVFARGEARGVLAHAHLLRRPRGRNRESSQ